MDFARWRREWPVHRPGVAAYTAVLVADTAVPAWHDGHREMPFVFIGSAATRFGVFHAGVDSTRDPKFVVRPQCERLSAATPSTVDGSG